MGIFKKKQKTGQSTAPKEDKHGRVTPLGGPPPEPLRGRGKMRRQDPPRDQGPLESIESPKLARRRENRRSTIKSGRTIGEKREHLETANERFAARKKDKRKTRARIIFVTIIFLGLIITLICLYFIFIKKDTPATIEESTTETSFEPTVEIIDEDSGATGGKITTRMREYIGQVEADFKDLGYQPAKAVLPSGAIREVDFYVDGKPGFVKMTIDRGSAVSVEDADRMFRYLAGEGITDFRYIDVRIDGKAFWH